MTMALGFKPMNAGPDSADETTGSLYNCCIIKVHGEA